MQLLLTIWMVSTAMIVLSCSTVWKPMKDIFPAWTICPLFLWVFMVVIYYLLLEPIAGAVFGVFCFIWAQMMQMLASSSTLSFSLSLYTWIDSSMSIMYCSLLIHIVCWILVIFRYVLVYLTGTTIKTYESTSHPIETWTRFIIFSPFYFFLRFLFLLGYRPELQRRVFDKVS